VVRPGVRRIDSSGKRTKNLAIALRRENHASGYANSLENCLERRGIRQEEKKSAHTLVETAHQKLALDAKDVVLVAPELEIRRREHRGRHVDGETRRRRQQ